MTKCNVTRQQEDNCNYVWLGKSSHSWNASSGKTHMDAHHQVVGKWRFKDQDECLETPRSWQGKQNSSASQEGAISDKSYSQ